MVDLGLVPVKHADIIPGHADVGRSWVKCTTASGRLQASPMRVGTVTATVGMSVRSTSPPRPVIRSSRVEANPGRWGPSSCHLMQRVQVCGGGVPFAGHRHESFRPARRSLQALAGHGRSDDRGRPFSSPAWRARAETYGPLLAAASDTHPIDAVPVATA